MATRGKQRTPRGELQDEVMAVIWRLGEASVEQVRAELSRSDHAYTTVHTVLTRLVNQGLIARETKHGGVRYRARIDEAEYIARTFSDRLTATAPSVRAEALRALVDQLDPTEVESVARYAERIRQERGKD